MKPEYDNIPTGATAAAMHHPSKAGSSVRSGTDPAADTMPTTYQFQGSGGYEYAVQPDGGIKIVAGPGSNTGLVVYPEGRNAKAYSAIAKEIAPQLTAENAHLARVLGENNAKAMAYKPPAPSPRKSGPTAGAMGMDVSDQFLAGLNADEMARTMPPVRPTGAAQNFAAEGAAEATPPTGKKPSDGAALTQRFLDPNMGYNTRQAAQLAWQFAPEQTAELGRTFDTLREHTSLSEEEAYQRAVSAAARVPPASPRSAPASSPAPTLADATAMTPPGMDLGLLSLPRQHYR